MDIIMTFCFAECMGTLDLEGFRHPLVVSVAADALGLQAFPASKVNDAEMSTMDFDDIKSWINRHVANSKG